MKQSLLHAGPIPSSSCTLPFLKRKIKISAEGSALATPRSPQHSVTQEWVGWVCL